MSTESMNLRVLNENIERIRQVFKEEKETMLIQIKQSTERFNEQDQQDFANFMERLKQENLEKLNQFFMEKAQQKSVSFSRVNNKFQSNYEETISHIEKLYLQIQEVFEQTREDENRKEITNEIMVSQFVKQKRVQNSFKGWKDWFTRRQIKKQTYDMCDGHYNSTLGNKCFISWRSQFFLLQNNKRVTYKPACESKIIASSERDIVNIQQHYLDIVNVLKNKISELDDLINVKRAAKQEFAYSLSKNLMKAISNLSIEVMSLNQIGLKDQKIDVSETQKFLNEMNSVINQKLGQITDVRQTISEQVRTDGKAGNILTFQEPSNPSQRKISAYDDI